MKVWFRIYLVASLTLCGSAAVASELGETVYNKHCAGCHDTRMARTPTRDALKDLSADTIVQALETVVEPGLLDRFQNVGHHMPLKLLQPTGQRMQ